MFIHKPYQFEELKQVTNANGSRYYIVPNGRQYPSITTMLSVLSKDSIDKWKERVGEKEAERIGKKARDRGTDLHLITEKYLQNEGVLGSFSPFTLDMFVDIQPILDTIQIVHNQEFNVYSHILKCAGSSDLLCTFEDKLTIMDFKTSSKKKQEKWIQNYFLQACLYSMCIFERINIKVPQIAILIAVEHSLPQLFVKQTKDYVEPALEFIKTYYESNN